MSLPLYTGPELARRSGATYRQIDHWTTRGYLRRADVLGLENKSGQGHTRVFWHEELVVASGLRVMGMEALAEALRSAAQAPGLPVLIADGFELTHIDEREVRS